MNEKTHTPGPWYATRAGLQGLIIDEATGTSIAVSYDAKHGELIAAAPDLLAAIRNVLREAREADRIYGAEYGEALFSTATIAEARAAIAKAEGGAK